jgi:putative transposase
MQLRYNFRVYPTPGQQIAWARAFGCARVVYNDALTVRENARREGLPYVTDAELSKALTAAKKDPARVWLGEVSSVVLQQALADLNTAYRNFFASVTGKRKGTRVGAPRYRSRRDNRQAIRFTKNARFQVTAVVEVGAELLPEADTEVGIGLGLSTFAVLSNGKTIASPRFLRQLSGCCLVNRRARPTGSRLVSGSPRLTLAWPICGGIGHISSPRRLSARTKRCSSRTYA